jgi:hypothetical protein
VAAGVPVDDGSPSVEEQAVPSHDSFIPSRAMLAVHRGPLRPPFDHLIVEPIMHLTGTIGIEGVHGIHAGCPGSTSFGVFFSRWGVIFAGLSCPGTPRGPEFFALDIVFGSLGLDAGGGDGTASATTLRFFFFPSLLFIGRQGAS